MYHRNFVESLTGLVEGTADIVHGLRERGVPVYALTNWSAETFPLAQERIPELGLFDDLVVSGAVGMIKPDPRIYNLTAARFGLTPEAIVFTDDSAANVEGARAAGWDAVHFTDAPTLARDLAERGLL